jgi:hypothetical protein
VRTLAQVRGNGGGKDEQQLFAEFVGFFDWLGRGGHSGLRYGFGDRRCNRDRHCEASRFQFLKPRGQRGQLRGERVESLLKALDAAGAVRFLFWHRYLPDGDV